MCDLALHRCQGKLMNVSSMNVRRYKWWGWTPVVWWLPISVVGLTVYAGVYNAYYTHRHHISQVYHLQWCFSLCSWFARFTVRRQNHTTDVTNPQVIHCYGWEHSRITLTDNVPMVKNHRTKRASITSNCMYHLAPMKYHVSQTDDLNQGIRLVAYARVTVRVNAILSSPQFTKVFICRGEVLQMQWDQEDTLTNSTSPPQPLVKHTHCDPHVLAYTVICTCSHAYNSMPYMILSGARPYYECFFKSQQACQKTWHSWEHPTLCPYQSMCESWF